MLSEEVPYDDWTPTKETLHRFVQIVGKLRLALSVRRNHWWNVPFHLTGTGITTRPMGDAPTFSVDVDFIDHRLHVATAAGARASFSLVGQSVASFHRAFLDALEAVGVDPAPVRDAAPFDLPDADRRFADDTEHTQYDPIAVTRYWRTLSDVNLVLEEFSGRFSGKTSPVHHFWHTFDIAATRFSDVVVPHAAGTDSVTREAYSREVVSAGFWFGDDSTPYPAFYSYTSPEPAGIAQQPLPEGAMWVDRGGSHLAVYPLTSAQATGDPRAAALAFFEASYVAGATLAGWDVERYRCVDGATDPHRLR
ncbi:DUF5996 family protein [Microbacterium sp. NPDC089189]|uniref:DUF5996 family protein n=1 Tax=Microbacterium sp. NPDC089189 TaxID=3154972 RepID=UPI0034490B15